MIDHDLLDADQLPDESAITAVTLADLAAGPHATEDKDERARRQEIDCNGQPLPGIHTDSGS